MMILLIFFLKRGGWALLLVLRLLLESILIHYFISNGRISNFVSFSPHWCKEDYESHLLCSVLSRNYSELC